MLEELLHIKNLIKQNEVNELKEKLFQIIMKVYTVKKQNWRINY